MAYPDLSITYFVLRVGQAKPRGFHTQTIASLLSELPQELVRAAHYAASEIQSRLVGLAEEHARLLETWRKRQELFLQSHSFQVFLIVNRDLKIFRTGIAMDIASVAPEEPQQSGVASGRWASMCPRAAPSRAAISSVFQPAHPLIAPIVMPEMK